MCIIDEDHMIYGSWNIRCSRQNFLLFWAMFCTFTPLKTWKIKIVTNKKKNTRRYYHFTHVHHKWQSYDVWFLRYGAQQRIFCHLGSFFGLLHPYGPRKSKFSTKKNQKKKQVEILSFYIMCIIWCMAPVIWSATDRLFCHFGPFFTLFEKIKKPWNIILTNLYHKWQSYDVWFLWYGSWQTDFFVLLDHFLPFYPFNNPKNHNF